MVTDLLIDIFVLLGCSFLLSIVLLILGIISTSKEWERIYKRRGRDE